MSFNRENVVWQSADGTWGRGFYESYSVGSYDDDDYDPEWDVDYDYDTFAWVSVGHATEEAARASWDGANPGTSHTVPFGESGAFRSDEPLAPKFDEMAVQCAASGRYARGVSPQKVQDAKDQGVISRFYFTQRSHERDGSLSSYFAADDAEQAKAVRELVTRRPEMAEYARECRERKRANDEEALEQARKRARDEARWGGRSTAVSDAMARIEATNKLLDSVKVPAAPKTQEPAASERRKTTAASTAGSFAPKLGSAPNIRL